MSYKNYIVGGIMRGIRHGVQPILLEKMVSAKKTHKCIKKGCNTIVAGGVKRKWCPEHQIESFRKNQMKQDRTDRSRKTHRIQSKEWSRRQNKEYILEMSRQSYIFKHL